MDLWSEKNNGLLHCFLSYPSLFISIPFCDIMWHCILVYRLYYHIVTYYILFHIHLLLSTFFYNFLSYSIFFLIHSFLFHYIFCHSIQTYLKKLSSRSRKFLRSWHSSYSILRFLGFTKTIIAHIAFCSAFAGKE